MNFYDRYLNGEDGRVIYADIHNLGQAAFADAHFRDVQNVLVETFNRVAFNLRIIFEELERINYGFKIEYQSNSDAALLSPPTNANELIIELEDAVKDFGYVPYSLKCFYKIVGSCNFAWDYDNNPEILWERADPIQINSLDDLVSYVIDSDWQEFMTDVIEDDNEFPHLELAADYLHKDNISGGPAYSVQITKEPSIDSLFLNEEHQTSFINYLRICMESCGFPGMVNNRHKNGYESFFERVKPQLKKI